MGQAVVPFMARVLEHAGISPVATCRSSAAVHGAVHVAGSMKVTWYCIASRPVRVNRSISRRPGDDPRVCALRLVVSTTSVVPSQRPRASPMYMRMLTDNRSWRGAASIGMIAGVVNELVGDGDEPRRSARCASWRCRRQGTSRRESRRHARCSGRRGRSPRTSRTARRAAGCRTAVREPVWPAGFVAAGGHPADR